jgi:hypothetical protein
MLRTQGDGAMRGTLSMLCLTTTLILYAAVLGSPVRASSVSEQLNEGFRELARKLAICILDRTKCIPIETETERECHLIAGNQVCCEIWRSITVELDTKLLRFQHRGQHEQHENPSSPAPSQQLIERLTDPHNIAQQSEDAAETLHDLLDKKPGLKAELARDGSSEEQCTDFTRAQVKQNYTPILQQLLHSGSWPNFWVSP